MTIDNTMTNCIPRKINKSYKLKMHEMRSFAIHLSVCLSTNMCRNIAHCREVRTCNVSAHVRGQTDRQTDCKTSHLVRGQSDESVEMRVE